MTYQARYKKGDRIGGRYLVHQSLLGGMGEVYLCLDEEQNYPYALKTFQGSDLRMKNLFEKEVANWIALEKHPNIVRLFYTQTLDNIPFMLLEWIASDESRGTDLRSWLRNGALDIELALKFTIDIVRGLQHANEKSPGIIHRDLKPDNVLVNQSRQAKITDFGLATVVQESNMDIGNGDIQEMQLGQSMRVGNVVGTPAYMPPEQWRGETTLDFRTDMYAVGCILYEMLTGTMLYKGYTISELRAQHMDTPLPALNLNFQAELKTILEGCLAKNRSARYETLDLLLADLTKIYEVQAGKRLAEIEIEDFSAVDYSNRGTSYGDLGQYQRAIQDFDQAIRLNPNYTIAYSNRGNSYHNLGQHERAIQDYEHAIQLNPNDASSYYNRGNSYRELGQHERAIQDYDTSIQLDPNLAIAYYNRGNSYSELGQHERAIQDYEQVIRLDPNDAIAYYNRGLSYKDLGQTERAIQDFDQAIRLDPNYATAYSNRGNSYSDLGQYQRAIKDYDQAIRLDPNLAIAYYNRGTSYGDLGQTKRAINDYEQVIRLNPNDALAYFNKGATLANTGRLEEALPLFEKAHSLGFQQAVDAIQQVRQMLRQALGEPQSNANDPQVAFEAFQQANSLEAMQQIVQQFPVLVQMIPSIQQVIDEQIPAEAKPAFEQCLAWLKQVIKGDQS